MQDSTIMLLWFLLFALLLPVVLVFVLLAYAKLAEWAEPLKQWTEGPGWIKGREHLYVFGVVAFYLPSTIAKVQEKGLTSWRAWFEIAGLIGCLAPGFYFLRRNRKAGKGAS